jgi:hypothetical protein
MKFKTILPRCSGLFWQAIALMGLLGLSLQTTAEVYQFQGGSFNVSATGSYTATSSMSGQFTTAAPLPANVVNQDISALITDWSFSDSDSTFDSANATILFPGILGTSPLVSTDDAGNVITANIIVVTTPVASLLGDVSNVLTINATSSASLSATCTNVNGGTNICDTWDLSGAASFGNTDIPSVWQTVIPPVMPSPSAKTVPTLSSYGLVLTALGLIIVATRRLSRSKVKAT